MFATRYFPSRYFADRYWPAVGADAAPTPPGAGTSVSFGGGGVFRWGTGQRVLRPSQPLIQRPDAPDLPEFPETPEAEPPREWLHIGDVEAPAIVAVSAMRTERETERVSHRQSMPGILESVAILETDALALARAQDEAWLAGLMGGM